MSHDAKPGERSAGYVIVRPLRLISEGSTPQTDASKPTARWTCSSNAVSSSVLSFCRPLRNSAIAGNRSRSTARRLTACTENEKCRRNGSADCRLLNCDEPTQSTMPPRVRLSSWRPLVRMSAKIWLFAGMAPMKWMCVRLRMERLFVGNVHAWLTMYTVRRKSRFCARNVWAWLFAPPLVEYEKWARCLNSRNPRSVWASGDLKPCQRMQICGDSTLTLVTDPVNVEYTPGACAIRVIFPRYLRRCARSAD